MKMAYREAMPPEELGASIAEQFAEGKHYVHLQGLPVLGTESDRSDFIRETAGAIGELTLTAGKEGSELWRLDKVTSPSSSFIPFHTDSPYYARPEEIVSFWNIKSSSLGGENLVLPLDRFIGQMTARPETSELLEELATRPATFRLKDHEASGVILDPITGLARYDQKYITPEHAARGERFATMIQIARPLAYVIKLTAGDALFFDNHKTLHARESYSDPDRLSIRVRMQTTNA